MVIKNEKGEYWCCTWRKKPIFLNSYALAHKFPTGAEARKVLLHLKDTTNNNNLKIANE